MKATKLLLTCVFCVALVPTLWSQTANNQSKAGILGYLDPHTGAFRPAPQASDDAAEPAAFTTFGGTITVTLTITVKSSGLTNFSCTAEVGVNDDVATSARGYVESATAVATGSGSTRTCKLTIPYSWSLATQPTDSMTVSYGAVGTAASTLTSRTSGLSPLSTQKVPANGATTSLSAAVTL
jgi:hypothetical protein